MASNSFGEIFRITTFGESHGEAIGVVIDGCPAGLPLEVDEVNAALACRRPGQSEEVSPRQEADEAKIVSGVFEGKTTGAPIAILIANQNADSSAYESIKDLLRPGHANFTYLAKYGVFDYRGGGRASARETACRVAAGVVAAKFLEPYRIQIEASLKSVGDTAGAEMLSEVKRVQAEGDSVGGVVEFVISNVPVGLGDPVYGKLDAKLAHAMMSIPATKGFEIGDGFAVARMRGSESNDIFTQKADRIVTQTNHAGGILGGISTGMPIVGRVAFKPTPSIMQLQETLDREGHPAILQFPKNAAHDPCVAIRAVPVVEAMCKLVMADTILLNRM